MSYIAQLNIAEMRYPADDLRMKAFMDALVPVNTAAEQAPGFIWRLKDESDNATNYQCFGRDDLLVNLSVWQSIETLKAFVTSSEHLEIMRRRSEWFLPLDAATLVLWWLDTELLPSVAEAEKRLIHLRQHGPSDYALNFKHQFSPTAQM